MIEAYPLAGVMGTILAIGAALQVRAATGASSSVNVIVERFGDAIWSTFAGLLIAISLMFLNSLLEPSIERIAELKLQIRELVARVKRELPLVNTDLTTTDLMTRDQRGSKELAQQNNQSGVGV
jgi:biopolymer transport protein ExbB/TolQ